MCCDINLFVVRQFMLLIAIGMMAFASGIQVAFPSVLNPAILAPGADIKATSDEASWIAASLGFGGLVGCSFMPVIFETFGRKMANMISTLAMFIGSLICYKSNDVYLLIVARFIQGISLGGSFSCIITLCECVPPKRRGYFVVINNVSIGFGSLACHALGLIWDWRQIAIFGALPSCISMTIFMLIAESPSFFAQQMQFDKCEKAFRWYRGDSLNAEKELKELIKAQKENFRIKQTQNNVNIFKKTKDMLLTKDFQKSFFIVTLAILCVDFSGRYVLIAYITQILLEITNNNSLALYMSVVSDCIIIFSLCVSSILVKKYERRTLLFKSGFCSVFLMFVICLTIILKIKVSLFENVKWLTIVVLLLHVFMINVGLTPIAITSMGEVFSLEHRGLGSFLSGYINLFFFNVIMKITPMIIDKTGVEGTYGIYGLCLLICLLTLRVVLPETKDKTLQRIEDEIKGIVRNNSEVELIMVGSN